MEKVFATILSLAIMVALVAGVMSLINDDDSKEKKNYIDLNEMNEAGSENDNELTGLQNANNETTNADEENNLAKNEATEAQTTEPSAESGRWFDRKGNEDVTESSSEAGTEVETVTDAQTNETLAETKPQEVAAVESEAATDDFAQAIEETQAAEPVNQVAETEVTMPAQEESGVTPVTANTATVLGYTFGADSSLMWPVLGDVVLGYNMTNTIYFPTLGVYKCNPAMVISCEEGTLVSAAADGIVMSVFEDEETGLTMQIAIGNEYVLTYGQLKDLTVGVGSQVKTGDVIAAVAAPTAYYSVEGTNLYFRLDSAEEALDPMEYIEGAE